MLEVRDSRLYRKEYSTFEEYCRTRWGMARQTAYQLMDAAEVVENVRHGGQILPSNERQARPLTSLPPEVQAEAWQRAVETAPDGKITAAHVQNVPIGTLLPATESQARPLTSLPPETQAEAWQRGICEPLKTHAKNRGFSLCMRF